MRWRAGWAIERRCRSSAVSLATIEVIRACRRVDEGSVSDARQLLAGLDLIPLSGEIVERAALINPAELRTLDAVHLASALSLSDVLTFFVAYDRRLRAAAEAAGLQVVVRHRSSGPRPR